MSLTRCCSGASRKSRLIWTVTRLFDSPFDPAVETTESIVAACCHNCAEIKADVDVQVLSHAERDIRCLGIASSDADGKWVFRGESHVFRSAATGHERRYLWSRRTRYSSEDDHGRPRRDCEGNVSCDWCKGTKIPTTKDTPANKADTLRDRFGELVEGCDGFAGVHLEHKFQIVQVLKSRGRRNGMTGDGVNHAPY